MHFLTLRADNLRVFRSAQLVLEPGWNLIVGANGAGKTTLLEAAYLLSHGRSFRTAQREAFVRVGETGCAVFGSIQQQARTRRVGLARQARRMEARVDGATVPLVELLGHVAVLCFEPDSHNLIAGAADERRRYLDWGVFHVEHEFLVTWRRYQRALRQRNALLRAGTQDSEREPWDHELSRFAAPLAQMRSAYFDRLVPLVEEELARLVPELGAPLLTLDCGFDASRALLDSLADRIDRDRALGHTTVGPHRADMRLGFALAPRREHLSRGQQKLVALALVLAQARLFQAERGDWPVICLDDIASEVDQAHRDRALGAVAATGAQVLLAGTEVPEIPSSCRKTAATFHVEHGEVRRLL